MARWCCVNLQCRGVLLMWIRVGQGRSALAVGADGGCLDMFSLIYHFPFLSPSLWETAQYRLKYCLKEPLSPKQTNQQINIEVWNLQHSYPCIEHVHKDNGIFIQTNIAELRPFE